MAGLPPLASLPVPELAVFFLLGLLGGAHCLGMCGPLVTMYADRLPTDRGVTWFELRQHALFNAGRTASYTLLGAAVAALGGLVFDVAALAALGDAVRVVTGVAVGLAIVGVGVGYVTRGSAGGALAHLPLFGGVFRRATATLSTRVDAWVGGPRILALGAIHGLLPCPLLYPAFLYAFASGSPRTGALALAALGVGTFPTLFAYGAALGSLDTGTRVGLHRALGVVFVVLGTVPLAHALALLGVPLPHVPLPMPDLPLP
jgi:sulfite exporter TauE/SafE